jgi:hypothetical protein
MVNHYHNLPLNKMRCGSSLRRHIALQPFPRHNRSNEIFKWKEDKTNIAQFSLTDGFHHHHAVV